MKQDLDHLMEERGLDAFVVGGGGRGNPSFHYLTNGAAIMSGYVIKRHDHDPVLVCSSIEREEAAASGLDVVNMNRYDYATILREKGDQLAATVELYRRMFADLDVSGKVGFYGRADQGNTWMLLNALKAQLEGVEVYGEFGQTLIDVARATKDAAEAERIRETGQRTCEVIGETVEFLQSHQVKDQALVHADGSPLTLGQVRAQINRFIVEHGLEDPQQFIFALGRDAGVPHNKGNEEDVMVLGKTIVFDIFPREAGGGYFADVTRTFCLGYAPPEIEQVYRDVFDCATTLIDAFEVGEETRTYQKMTCELLESRGHPTVGTDTQTEVGYVHSLGHGIGLAVHEEPYFRDSPDNDQVILPGHVFTCEPGLYYPDRGFGVRLEDDLWVAPDGEVHNLTDYPKELVIKV